MSNLFESLSFPLPFPELIQNISDAVPAFEIKREAAKRQLELLRKDPDISCTAALKIFDEMQRDLIAIVSIIGHLESVCTTDSIRAANTKLQELSAEFFAWLNSDPELYRFFSGLSPEPSVERTLRNLLFAFESSGAKLAPTQRERFIEIERELSELTNRLGEAVVDSTRAWNWHAESREELSGLLDSDCDAAKEAARAAGKTGYLFTLHAPSYLAILQFHKNRAVREHFARAYSRIASEAPHDNSQRISRILQLRAEKASLLGYENFVDLVTTDRMAKNAENIRMFFESMEAEVLSSSLRDLNALTQFAWKNGHPAGEPLKAWDMAFYLQRHEEQELGLDLEVIREYFPFEDTLERIFAFLSELFGVRFSTSKLPVWSEGVNSFNASGFGRSFGSLYTDYYARENKRAGAWMDMLMPAIRGAHPGIGFMAGNFSRPTADRPALLTHAEITTLFHEAGHLLHGLVCETERALDGMTHVAWDFIEVPSQFLENWAWEPVVLKRITRHYKTGQPMPDDLIAKLVKSRYVMTGLFYARHLGNSALDLALHTTYREDRDGPPVAWARNFLKKYVPYILEDSSSLNAFTHIFSSPTGYAGGYYSYLWSESLEADMYTAFENGQVLDKALGERYVREVLMPGNTLDASELFKNFMGRSPNPKALLKRVFGN